MGARTHARTHARVILSLRARAHSCPTQERVVQAHGAGQAAGSRAAMEGYAGVEERERVLLARRHGDRQLALDCGRKREALAPAAPQSETAWVALCAGASHVVCCTSCRTMHFRSSRATHPTLHRRRVGTQARTQTTEWLAGGRRTLAAASIARGRSAPTERRPPVRYRRCRQSELTPGASVCAHACPCVRMSRARVHMRGGCACAPARAG